MEQDSEELEMQNNSNNIFDNFINRIEEHPEEAGVCIVGLLATLGITGITNIIQWRKSRKEQKRHEEVENLQKDAIQKQDAQIQDYKDLFEENEYLKKLNSSLCDTLAELSEGGKSDNEG